MVKRYGFDRHGRQRFRCLNPICGRTFMWLNKANKQLRENLWFKQWIREGYNVRQLAEQSGHSPGKIRGIIRKCLTQLIPLRLNLKQRHYLLCDGTFIEGREHGLFAIMDANEHTIISGGYGIKEKLGELIKFFKQLKLQGLKPKSFTTDGNTAILLALKTVWPKVIIQRCLVHIQRQGLMWCRANPKRTDGQILRRLFLKVTDIRDKGSAENFLQTFFSWDETYGSKLLLGKTSGWVVSDLVRARSLLYKALPDMFHFLVDPEIVRTTNGLEGYFSRLKEKYQQHRGLGVARRTDYFKWYLHIVNH